MADDRGNIDSRIKQKLENNPFMSKTELAYELIFEEIINGTFRMGQRLNQDGLTLYLHMSRSPIRDALNKLASEGYVVKKGAGYKVYSFDYADYSEFFEFRNCVESFATYCAAANITDEQLDNLGYIYHRMIELSQEEVPDFYRRFELDSEFHNIIFQASDNRYAIRINNEYSNKVRFLRFLIGRHQNYKQIVKTHEGIYTMLKNRDQEGAKNAMSDHIKTYRSTVDKILKEKVT